ncbi:protein FAM221B-like [Haliotis asinina]|uniref:protein FAM221B-like n=1 Tax=Haliotis asinina TaxID=109174 RepID=UPI003531C04C
MKKTTGGAPISKSSGSPAPAGTKKSVATGGGRGKQAPTSKAVVPRGSRAMAPVKMTKQDGILVPEGYTMRKIEPAKNYDVVSFARAMNDDFAPRLKKLFDPETEAAVEAQKTGIYIGWRCPEFNHDCQRINKMSKCFCGHLLGEHDKYTGHSVRVPCKQSGCPCKAFAWVPSRPEDIGEFWFQRRRDFDVTTWRCKCKCKHTHEEHDPNGLHRCKNRGCSCGGFFSNFLCAACDKHWENHETFFETEDMRREKGLPVGEMYLPFAEMPNLRNITLTGEEYDDSRYLALTQGEGSIPQTQRPVGNNAAVSFGGGGGGARGGFKPVYD